MSRALAPWPQGREVFWYWLRMLLAGDFLLGDAPLDVEVRVPRKLFGYESGRLKELFDGLFGPEAMGEDVSQLGKHGWDCFLVRCNSFPLLLVLCARLLPPCALVCVRGRRCSLR